MYERMRNGESIGSWRKKEEERRQKERGLKVVEEKVMTRVDVEKEEGEAMKAVKRE